MGCFVWLLALIFPRLTLLVLWFTGYLGRAFDATIWPLLGFFFLPLTTLALAWAINTNHGVSGIYLVLVVVAALMDLGIIGGSRKARQRQRDK